jgi:hypothetical protein
VFSEYLPHSALDLCRLDHAEAVPPAARTSRPKVTGSAGRCRRLLAPRFQQRRRSVGQPRRQGRRTKMSKWGASLIALFFGGLAGAVFTWYMNHPRPTTLAYSLVTTTTGTDPAGSPLVPVPDLHIYIGTKEISSLYTHFVTITAVDGPQLEQLPIAVLFTTRFTLYSFNGVPPSPLHHFDCKQISTGLTCTLGPLLSKNQINSN